MTTQNYSAMLETARETLAHLESERERLDQQEQQIARQIAEQRYQIDAKAWAVRGQIELLEQLQNGSEDENNTPSAGAPSPAPPSARPRARSQRRR